MASNWLVIGISGITCGGKTTLANYLQQSLPNTVIIRQDLYFHPDESPLHIKIPELNHFNHDTIESLDMESLMADVQSVLQNNLDASKIPKAVVSIKNSEDPLRVLIVEGFIVLNYKPLRDLCDLQYQIELTKEQCWKRRALRKYKRPDVPGYLEKCVWPESVKHNEELKSCTSITFFDGMTTELELLEFVLKDINKKIEEKF